MRPNWIDNYLNIRSIGYFAYFILFVFSVVFFIERIVFVDTSSFFVTILETDNFSIQHNRFPSMLSQIPLIAAVALKSSLRVAMVVFSASFVCLYFLYFRAIDKVIQNQRFLLVPVFVSLLMCAHSFYWIVSEFQQGIMLSVVFLAAWQKKQETAKWEEMTKSQKWENILLYLGFAAVVLFSHPLMIFIVAYGILFLYLDTPHKKNPYWIALTLAVLLLCWLKHTFHITDYDALARTNAAKSLSEHLLKGDFWQFKSMQQFLAQWKGDYISLPIVLLISSGYYIWSQKWLKMLLLWSAVIAYSLIVTVSFPEGADKFYFDNQYLALCFFISLPLGIDIVHHWATAKICIALVFGVVLFRLGYVANESKVFTKRLQYIDELLTKADKLTSSDRFITKDDDPVFFKNLFQPWTLGYDSMILTSLDNYKKHKTRQIMTVQNLDNCKHFFNKKGLIAFRWSTPDPQKIAHYFQVDTTKEYQVLPDSIR